MPRLTAVLARFGPSAGAALAVLLAVPSLSAPLLQDDVAHRMMLEDKLSGLSWGPLELYDFVGGPSRPPALFRENGYMPWFVDEDLRLRFFRPLSSALLAADWRLFGERTWASRLHTLAWFLAIVGLARALHRRVLPPAAAGLATLIFAIAEGHTVPIAWIAARHALVAAAFALAGVWLHVRGREDGWAPGAWLSPLALAAGLLAGEAGAGGIVMIAAWELLGRPDPLPVRLRALVPPALLGLAYLGFYVVAGYGVRAGGGYIGPDSGVEGAIAVLRHLLMFAAELIAATPSDAFGTATAAVQSGAAIWGAVTIILAWALVRALGPHFDQQGRGALRWLPLAAAAAAIPGAFAVPGGRVLTVALVPASAAVAACLVTGASALAPGRLAGPRRVFVGVTIAGFALGHLVSAPLLRWALGSVLATIAVEQHRVAAATPGCAGVMVLPAVADPGVAIYVPGTLVLEGRSPERLRVLSMAAADHRIERVTAAGFDLVVVGPERRRTLWERVYRRGPLQAGTRVTIPALDAVVLEDAGGVPVRVRFEFGEPLDSPHLCFYEWRGGRLSKFEPPPPGGTRYLPYERGLGGL